MLQFKELRLHIRFTKLRLNENEANLNTKRKTWMSSKSETSVDNHMCEDSDDRKSNGWTKSCNKWRNDEIH
jgi:hypothetical protein